VPIYRVWADDAEGHTHLEAWSADALAFENGPGVFKGVGGTVLGNATRVMLIRFEPGIEPPLHRANPGFATLIEGELVVRVSDGTEVALAPGDALRIESLGVGRGGIGGWSPANPSKERTALLALVQMPSKPAPGTSST
jgi:hypothetical protein